jgi:hypothetical protein
MLKRYDGLQSDAHAMYRQLVVDLGRQRDRNERIVVRQVAAFQWAAAAMSFEILLLLIALGGTI